MRAFSRLNHRIVLCVLVLLAPFAGHARDWQWSGVDRIVAIGDIHGAYDALVDLLKDTGLVNEGLDWTGAGTHLVIDGDILDRGAGSRKVMDLIMKLEPQAGAAGGMVHMVLGNHEVMNLTGDLAYTSNEEFASYAGDEDPADRQAALSRFRNINPESDADEEAVLSEFERKYPPGFFGHRRLFSAQGRYGQWLAGKPVLVKINDTLFVHGGLSKQVLGMDGSSLNNAYTNLLQEYMDNWATLADAGVLPLESDFYDHRKILAAYLENRGDIAAGRLIDSAARMIELNDSPFFRMQSVIWYRGNVLCNEVMAESELDAALRQFGAGRLVIGHTPTHNRRVLDRFGGKLIRADTGILKSHYHGQSSAVIIERGRTAVFYTAQDGLSAPDAQPRLTGVRPADLMTDDELEILLANSPIRENTGQKDGTRLLKLEYQGKLIPARFTPAVNKRKNRIFIPEVAAYRLDRMLGIDLVPAVVMRTVDGDPGAISLVQDKLISEQERSEKQLGVGAWCPLQDQFNLMYDFDILVHNEGRTPEEIRYTSGNWQLVLTGNHELFAARNGRPRYLKNAPVTLPDLLAGKLKGLDDDQLAAELGAVLDEKRRRAILKRRDVLLESANND